MHMLHSFVVITVIAMMPLIVPIVIVASIVTVCTASIWFFFFVILCGVHEACCVATWYAHVSLRLNPWGSAALGFSNCRMETWLCCSALELCSIGVRLVNLNPALCD